jgi:hypothetical protein
MASGILVVIDEPTHRSGVSATRVLARGWAVNPLSERGSGVSRVDLYLDGGPDTGGQYLGTANYGRERPDVAAALGGQRFLNSGWDLVIDLPRGPHTLLAIAAPSGPQPALVVPGVASVRATVGGMAGRTAAECGPGGYCTGDEGGEHSTGPGFSHSPLYAGNQYVGYGAFGHGGTTPPYGWWDANLPAAMPSLLAAVAVSNAPQFYNDVPLLYNQSLLSTLSTQGALGAIGGCVGPAFAWMGDLGLSSYGGYSYAFPNIAGLGTGISANIGLAASNYGGLIGGPLSVPFSGSVGLGRVFASGATGAWNGSTITLAGLLGGRVSGPGGVGGSFASNSGLIYPGYWGSETLHPSGCIQRL